MEALFIGVDGGGTKTVVSVEDEAGNVLGTAVAGPANIRISVEQAWQSINLALENILSSHAVSLTAPSIPLYAGMGLAGCEIKSAYDAFLAVKHPFKTLLLTSDAYTACLGAHGGHDGAIIIVGTGVIGFQIENEHTSRVGGWGFPHDDQGGGAWLGLHAISHALCCYDGRLPESALAKSIYQHFKNDISTLISWANQANSSMFAELAPIVIAQMQAGESTAVALIKQAAQEVEKIDTALIAAQRDKQKILPRTLLGGISEFIQPYLSIERRNMLTCKQASPDKGAILMVKKQWHKSQEKQ